jgi:fatty acid synthase
LDVRVRSTPKQKLLQKPVTEKYEFVPNETHLDLSQSVRINIQIVLEESMEQELRVGELIDHFTKARSTILMPLVKNVLEDIPSVYPELIISTKDKIENLPEIRIESLALTRTNNLSLIIATNIFQRSSFLEEILNVLSADGFVLTREDKDFNPAEVNGITILTQHTTKDEKLILFKRSKPAASSDFIEISSTHFEWISELQDSLKNENNVVVHCKNQQLEGILGFTKCIRREPGGKKVKCFFVMDEAPDFDPFDKFYRQQIEQDRAINVYKEAKWGTYRHLKLENCGTNPKNNVYIGVDNKEGRPTLEWIQGPPLTTNKDQDIIQVMREKIVKSFIKHPFAGIL